MIAAISVSGERNTEPVELSVVVISWNTCEILRKCLDSIIPAARSLSHEIILVDNGSSDGSVKMVQRRFPGVRLIENRENLGFPKAANQGMEVATGRNLALLNSDATVTPGSLETLSHYLDDNAGVAAVSPQLRGRGGHLQYSGGFAPSYATAVSQLAGVQALFGGRSHGLFVRSRSTKKPMPVDWLSGTCLVVKREAVEDVGMLDDGHFMYAEDLEYGLRLHRAGWQLHIVPWVNAVHYGGVSMAKIPEAKLLWLGALFRVAAEDLSRMEYTTFGLFLSASYLLRFALLKAAGLAPWHARGGREEVMTRVNDIGLYARTAFKLGISAPSHAAVFCQKLEETCRRSRLQTPPVPETVEK